MKKKPGEAGLVSRRSLMGRREALQSRREPGAMGSAIRSSGGLPPGALTVVAHRWLRSRAAAGDSGSVGRGLASGRGSSKGLRCAVTPEPRAQLGPGDTSRSWGRPPTCQDGRSDHTFHHSSLGQPL